MSKPGLKRFNWKNLSLTLIGLLIGLILCEVILRLFVPVRNVGPAITIYDPVYGSRLKKSYSATRITPEFTIRYTMNSLGFRGPEPQRFPYRPILFLGDSFTEGYGVTDGEEFPELVRESLERRFGKSRIPVVNAGIGNTGNAHWVKFLTHEGKRFNPRLIVLQFTGNDFYDNVRERFFTLRSSDDLIELPVPPPSFARKVQKVIELMPFVSYSYIIGFAQQASHSLTTRLNVAHMNGDTSSEIESNFEERLTLRMVEKALRICKQNNWHVFALIANTD